MPEPEFFIVLLIAGAVSAWFVLLAVVMFCFGWRKKSKPLIIGSVLPLGCGAIVFAPMLLLLILWICYWTFGDKSRSTQHQEQPPPAKNHLQMEFEKQPNA